MTRVQTTVEYVSFKFLIIYWLDFVGAVTLDTSNNISNQLWKTVVIYYTENKIKEVTYEKLNENPASQLSNFDKNIFFKT